jgi:glycosyltransferase involved in cell wall biosynthesis
VLVTRDRPNLLRRALASIVAQDYPGPLRVVIVYDGVCPDWRVAAGGDRPVLALENWRTPGSAGARNTGALAVGDCELVAFCDDWDTWTPTKLTSQVSIMRSRPGTLVCTCAAEVEFDGRRTPLLTGLTAVGPAALRRDRAVRLRSSSIVARQPALTAAAVRGGIGLFDEAAPPRGHEWDLLLRAA